MTDDRARLRVRAGFTLWLLVFALSAVLAFGTEPTGSGFVRGLNRIGAFYRWQFASFAVAIFVWLSAKGQTELPQSLRLMSRIPIYIQCLLGLLGAVVVALALVFK